MLSGMLITTGIPKTGKPKAILGNCFYDTRLAFVQADHMAAHDHIICSCSYLVSGSKQNEYFRLRQKGYVTRACRER